MLSVYFVDDDILIIEELKKIIDWSKYGFEIIGYNTKPLIAQKEIIDLKPTLVITDVQMDGLNGLEMANNLNKLVNSKFVFLSAYDRFDYAVEAIKIGAIRYIKKPINKNNLIELLEEIKNQNIEDFNNKIFNKMIGDFNGIEYKKSMEKLFNLNPFFPKNKNFRVICIRSNNGKTNALNLINQFSSFQYILYDDDILILLLAYELNCKQLIDNLEVENVTIVFSKEQNDYKNISDIMKKVRICSLAKFLLKNNQIIEINNNYKIDDLCKNIDTSESVYSLHQIITSLKEIFINNDVLVSDIQRIYRSCIYALIRLNVIEYQEDLISISAIDYYDNYLEMINDLLNYFSKKLNNDQDSIDYIIDQIKKDIKERISERVPLSYYSEKYGYYNSYLSKIFKNIVGVSFIEYVINLKMDIAKFKIENEPKKAFKEIALEVGYDDYYHFSKIFKKICDCSPQEFREKCLKNDKTSLN